MTDEDETDPKTAAAEALRDRVRHGNLPADGTVDDMMTALERYGWRVRDV